VNDTKVNADAKKLNERMEHANLEREKASKLKDDMDHIAADANRATVEKVPMATHQLTQKRGFLSGFTLATENANLSIEERKKLLENQKSENEMQIEQLREQHA